MAEKHKSKYKKPENKKYKARKDLKDYTFDDKQGKLNPKSTGDKQLNVLRKTDKPIQDDGKLFPKYNDDDRLYKDIEDGDYDPKVAAKRLKKRQDTEEKETSDVLKDKIENLTREQKERLVREYVRRKIAMYILEQTKPADTEEEPPAGGEETPPAADTAATPPTDAPAETPPPTDAAATPPATDAAATPPATDTAATPPATDGAPTPPTDGAAPATDGAPTAGDTAAAAPESTPEEETDKAIRLSADKMSKEGLHGKIKFLSRLFKSATKALDVEDEINFYTTLRQYSIRKLSTIGKGDDNKEAETEKPESES
jgi:hypothetical protein